MGGGAVQKIWHTVVQHPCTSLCSCIFDTYNTSSDGDKHENGKIHKDNMSSFDEAIKLIYVAFEIKFHVESVVHILGYCDLISHDINQRRLIAESIHCILTLLNTIVKWNLKKHHKQLLKM